MDRIKENELKAAGLPPAYLEKYGDEPPTLSTHIRLYNSVINGKNHVHSTYLAAKDVYHDHRRRSEIQIPLDHRARSTKKNETDTRLQL